MDELITMKPELCGGEEEHARPGSETPQVVYKGAGSTVRRGFPFL